MSRTAGTLSRCSNLRAYSRRDARADSSSRTRWSLSSTSGPVLVGAPFIAEVIRCALDDERRWDDIEAALGGATAATTGMTTRRKLGVRPTPLRHPLIRLPDGRPSPSRSHGPHRCPDRPAGGGPPSSCPPPGVDPWVSAISVEEIGHGALPHNHTAVRHPSSSPVRSTRRQRR